MKVSLAAIVSGLLLPLSATASSANDICVSTNGTMRVNMGLVGCTDDGGDGNTLVAVGELAIAQAIHDGGSSDNNTLVAVGDGSFAYSSGDGNTVLAARGGQAQTFGDGNTLVAVGPQSAAAANSFDDSLVVAVNGFAQARSDEEIVTPPTN